jgi:hypothetical protein
MILLPLLIAYVYRTLQVARFQQQVANLSAALNKAKSSLAPVSGPEIKPAPLPEPSALMKLTVPAIGQTVFTPHALLKERIYQLTFSGYYEYYAHGVKRIADAVYLLDRPYSRYSGLYIGSLSAGDGDLAAWTEDTIYDKYTCLYEGTGEPLSIRLGCPDGGISKSALAAEVRLLPPDTPPIRAEIQKRAEARAARERIHEEEKRRQRLQELGARVTELRLMLRRSRNLLDEDYRRQFVVNNHSQILAELRHVWSKEYDALMNDSDLLAALRAEDPEIVELYERRMDMVLLAERWDVSPTDVVPDRGPLPLTARTIPVVENLISDLYQFRNERDRLRLLQATNGNSEASRGELQMAIRKTAFCFEELKRYGIVASTPEEAEEQFRKLYPSEPAATYYEELQAKVRGGEQVSADPIRERLEDLHREKIMRSGQRRGAVRAGDMDEIKEIDDRLVVIRREFTELKDFLEQKGEKIEFKDYRDREESLADQFFKLYQQKQQVIGVLNAGGDSESAGHVEALYAEQIQKLFTQSAQNYT